MTLKMHTKPAARKLSLRDVETRPDVFQFRHVEVDEQHVKALTAVLQNTGEPLDRLTLWQNTTDGQLVVVDGHHRLEAYAQAKWRKKVPALVHRCSLADARLLALQENGKTRLPLTNEEKLDAAWSLVCLDCSVYSKRTITRNTGVSDGTVAKMRRTRRDLLKLKPDAELPKRWWQAMDELRGKEQREYTDDERQLMIEAQAEKLDEKIGSALGETAARQIEAAVMVVERRLGERGISYLLTCSP